jgi:hypothetical protein
MMLCFIIAEWSADDINRLRHEISIHNHIAVSLLGGQRMSNKPCLQVINDQGKCT